MDLRSLLAFPAMYRLFGQLVAKGKKTRDAYVRDYVKPEAGMRVFDLGCGPGDILEHLPHVDYVGIDLDASYIEAAKKRFGNKGTFRCEDVAQATVREPGSYDIVLANGLLHHLTDEECIAMLTLARAALEPTGRLVALDCCLTADQSWIARWFVRADRGKFQRTSDGYAKLAEKVFGQLECHVRHDFLRIPYTHHIMTCSGHARSL